MNLNAGALKIPVSALTMFDTLAILLLIPVFDQYVYPYFRNKGRPITMLMRIGLFQLRSHSSINPCVSRSRILFRPLEYVGCCRNRVLQNSERPYRQIF
jgi:hypothetical protein